MIPGNMQRDRGRRAQPTSNCETGESENTQSPNLKLSRNAQSNRKEGTHLIESRVTPVRITQSSPEAQPRSQYQNADTRTMLANLHIIASEPHTPPSQRSDSGKEQSKGLWKAKENPLSFQTPFDHYRTI